MGLRKCATARLQAVVDHPVRAEKITQEIKLCPRPRFTDIVICNIFKLYVDKRKSFYIIFYFPTAAPELQDNISKISQVKKFSVIQNDGDAKCKEEGVGFCR